MGTASATCGMRQGGEAAWSGSVGAVSVGISADLLLRIRPPVQSVLERLDAEDEEGKMDFLGHGASVYRSGGRPYSKGPV